MYPCRDLREVCHTEELSFNFFGTEKDLQFPKFSKPVATGYFSLNSDRDYEPNASELRYYRPPTKLPIDLNDGYSKAKKKKDVYYSEGLDHLLNFISDHKTRLLKLQSENSTKLTLGAEFVCYRGLLRLLMCTPYEMRDGWCIHVTRYNGTFYLWRPDTHEAYSKRQGESDFQRRCCSWGFKFEQNCLTTSPKIQPDTNQPVDECSEFACVFNTTIGGMNVLYGAEMDGISSEHLVNLNNLNVEQLKFIELKVRQDNLNRNQQNTFKNHKTRQWWCQAFLVGIDDIYMGLRTPNGLLTRIEHLRTNALPKIGEQHWNPAFCANFLIRFFNTLKQTMSDIDCPHTVYAFHFDPSTKRISFERFNGPNPHSFLPDWYIELFNKLNPNI